MIFVQGEDLEIIDVEYVVDFECVDWFGFVFDLDLCMCDSVGNVIDIQEYINDES